MALARNVLWMALSWGAPACDGPPASGDGPPQAAGSVASAPAPASPTIAETADPVDGFCGAIEAQWQLLDRSCTAEQRTNAEHEQARLAVAAAVTHCEALLRPSHVAGRIAFEPKPFQGADHSCRNVTKFEWAALADLTRLQSNCSDHVIVGLVADGSPCVHSFECGSRICAERGGAGRCVARMLEGEDCTAVEPNPFAPTDPCGPKLYCDRPPAAPALAGHPPSTTTTRADFPVRPGAVTVEVVGGATAPKPDIRAWVDERHHRFVRCFEAAAALDGRATGTLTLTVATSGPPQLDTADVPDGLRDCAVRAAWGSRALKGPAQVRVRFAPRTAKQGAGPPAYTGKCTAQRDVGDACGMADECWTRRCRNWSCQLEEPHVETCHTDQQCFLTDRCVLGICTPRVGPGFPCGTSADCLAGVCESGVCRAFCASERGPSFDPD